MTQSLSGFSCAVVALSGLSLFAQPRAVSICAVQVRQGEDYIQDTGMDARALGKVLSAQSLSDGSRLEVAVVTGVPQKELSSDIERHGCRYVVEMWRHESADVPPPAGIPYSSSLPSGGSSASYYSSIGDRDAILFSMREANSTKSIVHASAPPLTHYGKDHTVVFNPYTYFSKKIIQELNKREPKQ